MGTTAHRSWTWLLPILVILAGAGYWALGTGDTAEAVSPGAAVGPAAEASSVDRARSEVGSDAEREAMLPEAPVVEPESEAEPEAVPAAKVESVMVTGAAVRIDGEGNEHAGDDGELSLSWIEDGILERRDIVVGAGRFAFECSPNATLYLRSLRLAGRGIALEHTRDVTVPADRFLLLKGRGLGPVLLHVVAAEDDQPLAEVEVFSGATWVSSNSSMHPGTEPEGDPIASGASPLTIEPSSEGRRPNRNYWVRSPGRAWAVITLDHASGGERTVELGGSGRLVVSLLGNEEWLEGEVNLWEVDSSRRGYSLAHREPDESHNATFESLATGTYSVTYDRGWARSRLVFAEETVEVMAGQTSEVILTVDPPERPTPTTVSGTIRLPTSWPRKGAKLTFDGQDEASTWQGKVQQLPLAEMETLAEDHYAWSVDLAAAGNYEVAVEPFYVRLLLEVPPEGIQDLELVVPGPADVEIRVIDEATGDVVPIEGLRWSPERVEGVLGTPLLPAVADPETGIVRLRVPAMNIGVHMTSQALQPVDSGKVYALTPGENELEVLVRRLIGVRFRFLDGEAEVPWSWDWQLDARGVPGGERSRSRSIGMLWFGEKGNFELFTEKGIPGYRSIEGTSFEVFAPQKGDDVQVVEVPLERE